MDDDDIDTFFVGIGDINRGKLPQTTFLLSEDQENSDENSELGVKKKVDEITREDNDRELKVIQRLLEQIHERFFASEVPITDVKQIVVEHRRAVLKGASIAFSGIIPIGLAPEKFELWRLATMFGAECCANVDEKTTHLITIRRDTDKVFQALEMGGIIMVRPEWLLQCMREWRWTDEKKFLLTDVAVARSPRKTPFSKKYSVESLEGEMAMSENNLDELEEPFRKKRRLSVASSEQSTDILSDDDFFIKSLENDLL